MSAAQLEMLSSAADVVGPGGRLVYATCSSEPEENQQVVTRFLAARPDFTIERPVARRFAPLLDEDGYFQTLPHRDGLDAFFAAVLSRRRPADTSNR